MLERKHRLGVGQTGIVGYVTSTGNPRIALDTGADAVFFDNPDLPNTRSEMALPLMVGSQVIGALDVQSTEQNAFTQEDIDILTVLADQVSTAIQNARLYEESRAALAKAENISRQLTGEAWANVRRFAPLVGYHFDGTKPEPLSQPTNSKQANEEKDAYSVPVQLRNETIGRLRIKPATDGHQWTEDEVAIIHATAERVALAAENARLILESQKNAAKEQIIGEISSKIGSAISIDNIMQTTLREMGRILPGAEISIQVENE
jgi:GAF domain-containing protein